MKIIWAGNAHIQATGYGNICKHVVSYVQHNSKHKMVEFAVSGLNRCQPFDWDKVKVYGGSGRGGNFHIGDWPVVQGQEQADIWLVNFDAWATGDLIPRSGVKYVLYAPVDHDPLPPPWLPSMKKAYELVPYCTFGGRVMREGLGLAYPVQKPIYHGVDTSVFRPVKVTKTNAFGRETPEEMFMVGIFKNNQGTRAKYETQLEGFRMFLDQLKDKDARLYLHCYKTGGSAFNVADLARKFDLSGYVYLVNQAMYRYGLSEEDLNMMYNACDVILNCVAGEGFGLPVIEAFAAKKPVIATAFSSMSELLCDEEGEIRREDHTVLETERGWLVGISDKEYTLGKQSARRIFRPEDIAEALMCAYESPEKRKEKGEAGYKWVQQYDWERIGDQWIEYFNGLEKRIREKRYSWPKVKTTPSKNKTACAVFSFNRPSYLIQTLHSLADNTAADKCDWYLYQDGPYNADFPYTDKKGQEENVKLVNKCVKLLERAPFKHKKILLNTENACIGRQVQRAQKLFEKYDNVIFFDDDHMVSKSYIRLLLNLHKRYPDAIVGAQATEEKNIPKDSQLNQIGITLKQKNYIGGTNVQGPVSPGRWRYLAYLMPKSVYKQIKDEFDEYINYIGPSYQNLPHMAVCIRWGVTVSGFDGVLDKLLDNHGIARIATVIPRGKYLGKVGLFSSERLFKAMGFDNNLRYEFDEDPIRIFKEYK